MMYSDVEKLVWDKARELFPNSPNDQAHFVAIVAHESGFDPSAHATQGEDSQGLFQFGKELRKKYNVDKTSDSGSQLHAGADYVKELFSKHSGNWQNIMAEYNLGIPSYRKRSGGEKSPQIVRFDSEYYPRHVNKTLEYSGIVESKPKENITLSDNSLPKVQPSSNPFQFTPPVTESDRTLTGFTSDQYKKMGNYIGLLLKNGFR